MSLSERNLGNKVFATKKHFPVEIVFLCLLSLTFGSHALQARGFGMPESVRQEVEAMHKAGASHQEIRAYIEATKQNRRPRPFFNQQGHRRQGRNKAMQQFTVPHALNPALVKHGYNLVVDRNGNEVRPQGRPFQEGYTLIRTDTPVIGHNRQAYAKVFSIMAPIRDALIFNITTTSEQEWIAMTAVLEKNNIKTTQWLGGPTPRDNYYSNKGIFKHLKMYGTDYHPMMKYLEEAELELKSRVFSSDFDFTNPEGINHYPNPGRGLIE